MAGIAIRRGRVIAAGDLDELEPLVGPQTRRIRLEPGEVALPGLTDSHLHLGNAALALTEVQLADAATLEDGLRTIARAHAALDADAWLTGHGWANDRWGGWPTAADLERAAPGRRVALWAHDHHAQWVSYAALLAAGIGPSSPDPAGGAIRRDAHGLPIGVLHESATVLVTSRIPLPTVAEYQAVLPGFIADLVGLGVVAVHDPGVLRPDPRLDGLLRAYASLADSGQLTIRVHASLRTDVLDAAIEQGMRSGMRLGDDPEGRARLGWLKLFADGSLGSWTAAMLAPFAGEGGLGIWVTEPTMLGRLAVRAAEAGIASQIHGIGDAAVRAALDAFEPGVTRSLPLRARIEHAQLVDPADRRRFGQLGIVASVQPVHLRTDAANARSAWGARAEVSGYAWRSLVDGGATLAFGTDAPVEPIDPWPGLSMAITRRWPGWPAGTAEFGPDQALSLGEALRGACLGPAQAEGADDRGRLVAGQRADLIVIPAAAIAEPVRPEGMLATTRPRLVLIDGKVAFEA